jgi:hypothetical protein
MATEATAVGNQNRGHFLPLAHRSDDKERIPQAFIDFRNLSDLKTIQ